jgi:type III pantothenate kinase
MKLLIDSGNSEIVFCLCENADKLLYQWRIVNDSKRTRDEYAVWFLQLLAHHALNIKDIHAVAIASVVPQTKRHLCDFADHYICKPYIVDAQSNFGFKIDVDYPEQVGADRLVNGVSGMKLYGKPLVVLDFGTATSFDIFNHHGDFIGGILSPGIYLSMQALAQGAAQLSTVEIARTDQLIGRNTKTAIQSGAYWGYIAMIKGILKQLEEEINQDYALVLTGGLAKVFLPDLKDDYPAIIDSDLTLKGIALLLDKG